MLLPKDASFSLKPYIALPREVQYYHRQALLGG